MLLILALILTSVSALAQPTISYIATYKKTHSSVTLLIYSDTIGSKVRNRFGTTTAYEGSGTFPSSGIQRYNAYDSNTAYRIVQRVTGLLPNTTYNFCPQISTDGGSTWHPSTCVNHVETTLAAPAIHPAPPEPPALPAGLVAGRPDPTGYTPRAVSPDCSDFQSTIDTAAANLTTTGSVISIPAASSCTGEYLLKPWPGKVTFNTTNVNTSTNIITKTGHGFNHNDLVKVSGATPGSYNHDQYRQYWGLVSGQTHYIKLIDANNFQFSATPDGPALSFASSTFTADTSSNTLTVPTQAQLSMVAFDGAHVIQFATTGTLPAPLVPNTNYYVLNRNTTTMTMQVSATLFGAAVDLTTTGTGTHYITDQGTVWALIKWPPPSNWIIIRTSTPESEFVPEGVRVTPEYQALMPKIISGAAPSPSNGYALGADEFASNYWIEGIEFTIPTIAETDILTTINPRAYSGLVRVPRVASNIIFDRCYFNGRGYPNRLGRAIHELNGADSAIINSWLENLDYWTPVRVGMGLTRDSGTQVTIAAGDFYTGPATRSLASPVVITITGGSATGNGRVYYTMAGALTLNLPTGMSASCAGGSSCTVINSATPEFPVNAEPVISAAPLGTITFVSGAVSSVSDEALVTTHTRGVWEGAGSLIAGEVVARVALINNYFSSAGLPIHWDDNVGSQAPIGTDYTIQRNHIITPTHNIWNHPDSNKLSYGQRQQLEWKNGKRIRIRGNIFEHTYAQVTAVASAIAIGGTAGRQSAISDVEIGYNILRSGSGSISMTGGRSSPASEFAPPTEVLQRGWIHNNLMYNNNAYLYRGVPSSPTASGIPIDLRFAMEDVVVEHNTVYDERGAFPRFIAFGGQPNEGLVIRNNIAWVNDSTSLSSDECFDNTPSCVGDGFSFLATNSTNYEWKSNTLIAGWLDAEGTSPRTSKTYLTSAFPTETDSYLQPELPTNVEWRDPASGDFRILPLASHKSGGAKRGNDGKDRGVDMQQLDREIGTIHLSDVLDITANSASIPFVSPDRSVPCYIYYGTGAVHTWVKTPANTGEFARYIDLSGLTGATSYRYRVACSGTAMSAIKGFRTR